MKLDPAALLPHFVELARSEEMGGRPDLLLVAPQSLQDSLPKSLGPDSIFVGGQPIQADLADELNRLVSEPPGAWTQTEIEPLNRDLNSDIDWKLTVSRPFQLGNDRWYALIHQYMQKAPEDRRFIKKVAVIHFSFVDGAVSDPMSEVILTASRVEISR
jgi:hypothetical protein